MQHWESNIITTAEAYPAYRFQSTSTFTPVVGTTSYTTEVFAPATTESPSALTRPGIVRRDGWDFPEGQEVGVIDTPLGEPLMLLLMAFLYLFFAKIRKKSKNICTH